MEKDKTSIIYDKFPNGKKTYKVDKILPNEDDLPYLAGLFDGEGTICKNGKAVVIGLTNTDRIAVESFASAFGGYITYRNRYPNKDCWMWQLSNYADIEEFLHSIMYYLRIKKKQAEYAFEFLNNKDKEYRRELLDKITELNHKGNHYTTMLAYSKEA